MNVLRVRNVEEAYARAMANAVDMSTREVLLYPSRNGPVVVASHPVTTTYSHSEERVLFDPKRDANPFFHLFEGLWMLAGRNDAAFLNTFVSDFGARYAEADGKLWGAYGERWRGHFDVDQVEMNIRRLIADDNDRRCVIAMWDATTDLFDFDAENVPKDLPCNTHIYPRIRKRYAKDATKENPSFDRVLDITVCCRSNDIIWGAYGANAVHFSMLHEYMAGRLGVEIGEYHQVSNNWHAYLDVLKKMAEPHSMLHPLGTVGCYQQGLCRAEPMGKDWSRWLEDLKTFIHWTKSEEPDQCPQTYPANPWFEFVAEPLFVAHMRHKAGETDLALEIVQNAMENMTGGETVDWFIACKAWLQRRLDRKNAKRAAA